MLQTNNDSASNIIVSQKHFKIFNPKILSVFSLSSLNRHNIFGPMAVQLLVLLCKPRHLPRRPTFANHVLSVPARSRDWMYDFTYICFWVNLHLGHRIIIFHIFLPNFPTTLYSLYALAQIVGSDHPTLDGSFRDERNGGIRDECLKERITSHQCCKLQAR